MRMLCRGRERGEGGEKKRERKKDTKETLQGFAGGESHLRHVVVSQLEFNIMSDFAQLRTQTNINARVSIQH